MEQVELAPGRQCSELMLLVAEAALPWNNGLSFGTTGLCTWQGLRSPELAFLLLPHASGFSGGLCRAAPAQNQRATVQARP